MLGTPPVAPVCTYIQCKYISTLEHTPFIRNTAYLRKHSLFTLPSDFPIQPHAGKIKPTTVIPTAFASCENTVCGKVVTNTMVVDTHPHHAPRTTLDIDIVALQRGHLLLPLHVGHFTLQHTSPSSTTLSDHASQGSSAIHAAAGSRQQHTSPSPTVIPNHIRQGWLQNTGGQVCRNCKPEGVLPHATFVRDEFIYHMSFFQLR